MFIRLAYDIQFDIPTTVAMVALLNVHPSRVHDLLEPDELNMSRTFPSPATSTASATDSPIRRAKGAASH
ncbi:MAG TPA: hypothetical protein VGT08_12280 [Terracidiphilus sp.]|nr:hypothetical protein [Terracidiphilus sp.]